MNERSRFFQLDLRVAEMLCSLNVGWSKDSRYPEQDWQENADGTKGGRDRFWFITPLLDDNAHYVAEGAPEGVGSFPRFQFSPTVKLEDLNYVVQLFDDNGIRTSVTTENVRQSQLPALCEQLLVDGQIGLQQFADDRSSFS